MDSIIAIIVSAQRIRKVDCIPERKAEKTAESLEYVTIVRSGSCPRDPITEVTTNVDMGIESKFPPFLTRFIKLITAP